MKEFFSFLKNNQVKFIPILIIAFLVIATLITLILGKKSTDLRTKATSFTGILSFSPPNISGVPGDILSEDVSVILDTGGQAVTGADILIQFDPDKLTFTGMTQESSPTFKTYAPITPDNTGTFDLNRVKNCANLGGPDCPSGRGVIEFGILAFDWTAGGGTGAITAPFTGIMTPVTKLSFQTNPDASGTTSLTFKYDGQGISTDSNIVTSPVSGGNPEDILAAPTSSVVIDFSTTGSPQPSPSSDPSPTPSPSASLLPTPSPTTEPTTTPTPGPSPTPGTQPEVGFKLQLEGIIGDAPRPNLIINAIFRKNIDGTQISKPGIVIQYNLDRTFTSLNAVTDSQLTAGSYDVFISGPKHLTKKFTGQEITEGMNLLDFASDNDMLWAADIVDDNIVNDLDYNQMISSFGCGNPPATPPPGKNCSSLIADVDYNGEIDIADYGYLVGNYNTSGD